MKGTRPEQATLSRETDMSKTDETRAVIEAMVDGLNDHRIADIGEIFSDSFRWMGNAGCANNTCKPSVTQPMAHTSDCLARS